MHFSHGDVTIHISKEVLSLFQKNRQISSTANESFGVLIGSASVGYSDYYIDSITVPQIKDHSSRCFFILKDEKHQKFVDRAFEESNGERGYMGTWHTHPQDIPTPSQVDLADWDLCCLRNKDRTLFFIIVGIKGIRMFINENGSYKCLEAQMEKI